jgi:predicted RNA-binding Zn-ribbon protein involved in translation (DUF1610 family)
MPTLQTQIDCPTCGKPCLATKHGTSHIFHFIMTLVTLGLWIPIWLLAGLKSAGSPYRCTGCGYAG